MISLTTIAGGIAIAGSLALAPLGLAEGVAMAEPTPAPPPVTSADRAGQGAAQTQMDAEPSPYAVYGGKSLCGMPGMYFVNICG